MRSASRTCRRDGTVVVVVAVCLVVVMAVTALSLDGGMLLDKRRQAQTAADAAALAAADDLYYNWWSNKGQDPQRTAVLAARATAAANGFTDDQNGCKVTVNIPPQSGPFTGMVGHTEVIITVPQTLYFSRVFTTDDVTVGARAVSRGRRGGVNNGIIVLDPSSKGALSTSGNGKGTVTGTAPVLVNSSNSQAMVANGSGSFTAPEFDVVGVPGWATPGGGSFTGPIVPGSPPIADPLASLPQPDPSTLPIQSTKKVQIAGNQTTTLNPGVYIGGITITGQGSVVLNPGIYYMQGGGFSWTGQGSLTGSGVMIYNAPASASDTISLTGSGSSTLSPPTSGPYQGMTVFQARTATTPMYVSGSGYGQMNMSGTFYAASAPLTVTGNGTVDVIGAQYISYDLNISGNGTFNVNWDPNTTPGIREIMLVE